MITRKSPSTIPARLKIDIHGVTNVLELDYKFMRTSEFEELLRKHGESAKPVGEMTAAIVLDVVEKWDSEYPLTMAGLLEWEDETPGIMGVVISGFHTARSASRAKN